MRKKVKLFFIISAIFLFIIGVPAILFLNLYGDLMVEEDTINNKWGQVNYLYQRRMSSIELVMDTMDGFADEKAQLENVFAQNERFLTVDFVNTAGTQDSMYEKAQADITDAIQMYLLQVCDSNMSLLHSQDAINEHIAKARYDYNEAVRHFNTHIHHFPSSWVARIMGIKDKNYFESKP